MGRIKVASLALGVVLAMGATATATASAAKLTLSEGGVALPAGKTFEMFGFDTFLISTPAGNIECNEGMFGREAGLQVEVLKNSKSTDVLRVIRGIGQLGASIDCRTSTPFGNASISLVSSGPLILTTTGKATESPLVLFIRFERGALECHYKGSMKGTTLATTIRQLFSAEYSGHLFLDTAFTNYKECPRKADMTDMSVSYSFTRNEQEEENRIEEQVV
jgi:hypothetical protein